MQIDNEISCKFRNIKHNIFCLCTEKLPKISQRTKKLLGYLGPAFIVSVAYIDPGNFATNISAGSVYNYTLLWVILCSNIMAIFLQYNSAKLGIATGFNLPEMCKIVFPRRLNVFFWIIAEMASMSTTVAEFLGGALGFYLLFNIPLPVAGILTAVVTLVINYSEKYGQRIVEVIVSCFIGVISISYALELFLAKPDWFKVGLHTILPSLPNGNALLLAVGMLGATVMPHVIYLHSQLVQSRNKGLTTDQKEQHLTMEKIDIIIAMNIAFIVNAAMVIVSAAVFYKEGIEVSTIEQAHRSLQPLLGSISSSAFGIALLASGFSSSAVGTMAGETVMDGFINVKFPPMLKRLVTMVPAMIILLIGVNPMRALVLSQVSLSFALPFAIIPMLIINGNKELMGIFVNNALNKTVGWIITTAIILLNGLLLISTFIK